ncbi:hypothetical protein HF324_09080 [Chitinophaga oryzae]|uniref:DUF6603 domain-containing protein n=1 Tax=Chitinophaga oryzae TaxID=2725414 RepID=A0ABX6LCZ4_9BACT|nr:DUF6603 domain-containing protein [Chitinophaga oryzae]QJB37995.1 hypothetical protein HF324_09080 [Chitinophaga oryzae]
MDISELISKLRADASAAGQVVLNTAYLSDAQVATIQGVLGMAPTRYITIKNLRAGDIPDAQNSAVTITAGQADLLNQNSLPVKELIFTVGAAQTIDFILNLALPSSWQWTSSFPDLSLPPFTLLPVSDGYFVYTTTSQSDYQVNANRSIPLSAGLNFSCLTDVSKIPKLAAILGSVPSGNLPLSGTADFKNNTTAYPATTLLVPLLSQLPLTNKFKLSNLQLKIEITDPDGAAQDIITGLWATDPMFNLLFLLDNTSSLMIEVDCTPLSSAGTTLAQLSSCSIAQALIGSSWHFENFVPAALSGAFGSITFDVILSLSFSGGFNVRGITFRAYSDSSLGLGLFTLSGFQLNFTLDNPGGQAAAYVHMLIEAKIPLQTFKGNFIGTIDISTSDNTNTGSTWNIDTITAAYPDTVSFTDLIQELDPGITFPQELAELTFSDFSLEADPGGNSYTCACYGTLDMHLFDVMLSTQFSLLITHNGSTSYELKADTIVGETFLNADLQLNNNEIVFTGSAKDIPLTDLLASIFSDINIDLTILPEITLSAISIQYNTPSVDTLTITGSLDYNGTMGDFQLVGQKSNNQWQFVAMAGFDLNPAFDIGAHIPLVGGKLTGDLTLKKGYLIITSKAPQGIKFTGLPPNIPPGISFYFDLELRGKDTPVTLPVLAYSADFKAVMNSFYLATSEADISSGNTAYTIQIGKNLGPLYVDSLSLSYKDQVIYCNINATMKVGPFDAALDGLGIGTSLSAFTPSFSLNGLSFDFTTASFSIDGALIRIPDSQLAQGVSLQFDGALIVKIQQLGLAALGSYAQLSDGEASFFIFLEADFPPGGPPFFMVSGLMGGFGFNRTLALPTFDEVQNFPLLALDAPPTGSKKDVAMHTLQVLEGQIPGTDNTKRQWASPRSGDYWMALGVAFNSFEIINGKLLLTAELGRETQFSLLGLSWMALPQKAVEGDRLVFVELQMAAVLKPEDGTLQIGASLTSNSFVLTKDCHLTGGFAFYLWFGDSPDAGQFVLTAGGYHPAFKPPDYYPEVARLGFNWQVSGDVSIKGSSYFAFTPSCAMAGGRLQVQFQSGPLRAWFDAGANFLVTWHPLTFTASIWEEIGVSLTVKVWFIHKTLSASVGAAVDMWGPPIGGIVRVHVVFVTFKIRIGSDGAQDKNKQVLVWDEFKEMLPKPEDRCTIIANDGLTNMLEKDTVSGQIIYNGDTTGNPTTKVWFLRSGRLRFTTKSMIPATSLTYGNDSGQRVNGASNISIRPMNITTATAVHNLCITQNSASGDPISVDGWTFTANYGNVAATLWGQPITENGQFVQAPSTPSADTVGSQLTGYTVEAPAPQPGYTFGIVQMRLLLNEYICQTDNPQNPLSKSHAYNNDYTPSASDTTLADISTIGTTLTAARNALYAELQQDGLYTGSNDSMQQMGATANGLFVDIPMEQSN